MEKFEVGDLIRPVGFIEDVVGYDARKTDDQFLPPLKKKYLQHETDLLKVCEVGGCIIIARDFSGFRYQFTNADAFEKVKVVPYSTFDATTTETVMKEKCKELFETYKRKNADYGDSFSKSIEEWGEISAITRMSDKVNRWESLLTNEAQVNTESLADTIGDLLTYWCMLQAYRAKLLYTNRHESMLDYVEDAFKDALDHAFKDALDHVELRWINGNYFKKDIITPDDMKCELNKLYADDEYGADDILRVASALLVQYVLMMKN